MTDKRQGEIALELIRALARREGTDKLIERLEQLDKASSATGISEAELRTFCEIRIHEIVHERLAKKTATA